MDAFIASLSLVGLSEIGDKTQLLALMLVAKYRKPVPIILGILVSTLINFIVAAWVGGLLGTSLNHTLLHWIVGISLIGIGLWELRPEHAEKMHDGKQRGAFAATVIGFFIGEMGDKTQLAAVALGAQYAETLAVALGATAGMLIANIPCVLLGQALFKRLPIHAIRRVAAILFIGFGLWTIAGIMLK